MGLVFWFIPPGESCFVSSFIRLGKMVLLGCCLFCWFAWVKLFQAVYFFSCAWKKKKGLFLSFLILINSFKEKEAKRKFIFLFFYFSSYIFSW